MKTILCWLFTWLILLFSPTAFVSANNFGTAIGDSVETNSDLGQGVDVMGQLETKFSNISNTEGSAESIKEFLAYLATEIIIPIATYIWIFFALMAFYRLMTADTDEEISKASRFLLRWVTGIMVMISAWYLVDQLVSVNDPWWETGWTVLAALIWDNDWWLIASRIYENIFFPFLRMAIYVILWVLFIFALINALKLIFNADEQNEKKIITWITFAVVWVIVIIIAKSIVEIIYGRYDSIISQSGTNLWSIWEWTFTDPTASFALVWTVINWILGIVTFVIVIIIIYQGFLLLTKPNDEETMTKLRKSLGYIFIWILIIWAAYLIANFLIFQTN